MRFKRAADRAAKNPVLRQSIQSLKPATNLWGVAGVFLFFILPELIGFWRGSEIAKWAHSQGLEEPSSIGRALYRLLEMLFEDGGSWVNLTIGVVLLIWLFYEWRRS